MSGKKKCPESIPQPLPEPEELGSCEGCGCVLCRGDLVLFARPAVYCSDCGQGRREEGYFDLLGVDVLEGIPMLNTVL